MTFWLKYGVLILVALAALSVLQTHDAKGRAEDRERTAKPPCPAVNYKGDPLTGQIRSWSDYGRARTLCSYSKFKEQK